MNFLLQYFRLQFWPYPLSWDYSFNQIPIISLLTFSAILSLIIYLALIVTAFVLLRKRPVISFCLFFYFITSAVTNNLFFIIEATVSERFLFLSIAGFCIVMVELARNLFNKDSNKQSYKTAFIILPIVMIYAVIVWQHSPVWKDNQSLFEAGAKASPNSARANFALATVYRETGENAQLPDSVKKYFGDAAVYYEKGLKVFTGDPGIYDYLALCYTKTGDSLKAMQIYKNALQQKPDNQKALHEIALFYASHNMVDSSVIYAEKFVQYFPNNIDGYLLLTGAYFVKKDFNKAYAYAQKAYQADSTNVNALRNMAGVLQSLGKNDEATYYIKKMK